MVYTVLYYYIKYRKKHAKYFCVCDLTSQPTCQDVGLVSTDNVFFDEDYLS